MQVRARKKKTKEKFKVVKRLLKMTKLKEKY